MDSKRKLYREIEPLDEAELETDLRFLFHNRGDTVDQFIEEAIPMIKYHVNEVMARYQDRLMEDMTKHLRGEIAGVMLRTRREHIFHPKATIDRTPAEIEQKTNTIVEGGEDDEALIQW